MKILGKILTYRKRENYMLVFFIILITLVLISLLTYLSAIKIQIENIEIEKRKKIEINDFKINIYYILFNKIKLFKIVINKEKIKKINFSKLSNKIKEKNIKSDTKIMINALDNLDIKIESINIKAKFGLNNSVLMAYLVALINIIFSIIFAKISKGYKENYNYVINPYQTDEFYLNISINCIINMKIANIINMIIKNRSEDKNERTSDRSFNGNCHEQYTRYGRCKYYYRRTN